MGCTGSRGVFCGRGPQVVENNSIAAAAEELSDHPLLSPADRGNLHHRRWRGRLPSEHLGVAGLQGGEGPLLLDHPWQLRPGCRIRSVVHRRGVTVSSGCIDELFGCFENNGTMRGESTAI